jgi:succinyl-CoA synthetase beta subunit
MKLHEFQAKELLGAAGIPVPKGRVAHDADTAAEIAESIGGPVVVKAQVQVGGRGKAGGIQPAANASEVRDRAGALLGSRLKGFLVERVLVERAATVASELYLGITLDRARRRPVVMVSTVGGIDIEEVAAKAPERIARGWPDPLLGLAAFEARALVFEAAVPQPQRDVVVNILDRLYRIFASRDCLLAEINPLFIQSDGTVLAGDAKVEIDDNALHRQPELAAMKDVSLVDPNEERARELGFSYVRLDGTVGIIGNGAGLVMATLDAVKNAGGDAANFLDAGGGANAAVVRAALEIVLSDARVRSVLVNIFGGITRGDEVARGIRSVLEEMRPRAPLVVRLSGTRADEGRALLEGARLTSRETMDAAAAEAVRLALQPAARSG